MIGFNIRMWILALPMLRKNDMAHGSSHAWAVFAEAGAIAKTMDSKINRNIISAAALAHDVGVHLGRENHHLEGASWVARNAHKPPLNRFTEKEIDKICIAIRDHRSSSNIPFDDLSPLAQIIRTADAGPVDLKEMVTRAYIYRRDKLNLLPEEAALSAHHHIVEKFGDVQPSWMWEFHYGAYPRESILALKTNPIMDVVELERAYRLNLVD